MKRGDERSIRLTFNVTASAALVAGLLTAILAKGCKSSDASGGAEPNASRDSGANDRGAKVRPAAMGLRLPTTLEDPGVEPWFKVYRPADLSAAVSVTGQALPIVVWANGGCFRAAAAWEVLYERWAAAGFVVLALDVEPEGNAFAQTTVDHQGALIDWAITQAETQGGPYAGKLDARRIVAAGNSCGGVTALRLAARDERVKSVFVLSGSSALAATDAAIMGAISAPVGYVVGGAEDIAAPNAEADYAALRDGVPAMIVSRFAGDHVLVSTDAAILEEEAEMALNWMDLSLHGTGEALDMLTSATVCSGCERGVWKLTSKGLRGLAR